VTEDDDDDLIPLFVHADSLDIATFDDLASLDDEELLHHFYSKYCLAELIVAADRSQDTAQTMELINYDDDDDCDEAHVIPLKCSLIRHYGQFEYSAFHL
jgi:hypothetical protein